MNRGMTISHILKFDSALSVFGVILFILLILFINILYFKRFGLKTKPISKFFSLSNVYKKLLCNFYKVNFKVVHYFCTSQMKLSSLLVWFTFIYDLRFQKK